MMKSGGEKAYGLKKGCESVCFGSLSVLRRNYFIELKIQFQRFQVEIERERDQTRAEDQSKL